MGGGQVSEPVTGLSKPQVSEGAGTGEEAGAELSTNFPYPVGAEWMPGF